MRSAKRETVVQQQPTIGHIRAAHGEREPFAKILAERQVKGSMALQMPMAVDRRWRNQSHSKHPSKRNCAMADSRPLQHAEYWFDRGPVDYNLAVSKCKSRC